MAVVYPDIAPFLRSLEELTSLYEGSTEVQLTPQIARHLELIQEVLEDATRAMPFQWILLDRRAAEINIYTDASTRHGVGGFIQEPSGSYYSCMWQTVRQYIPQKSLEKHGVEP